MGTVQKRTHSVAQFSGPSSKFHDPQWLSDQDISLLYRSGETKRKGAILGVRLKRSAQGANVGAPGIKTELRVT